MTKEEKAIEDELIAKMEQQCAGREFCKGCPHSQDIMEYAIDGCFTKIAIAAILEARSK